MPGSAAGVTGYNYCYVSSVQDSVVSDLISVVFKRPEATEVGDVPVVAPGMKQLLYVEVRFLLASLSNGACSDRQVDLIPKYHSRLQLWHLVSFMLVPSKIRAPCGNTFLGFV